MLPLAEAHGELLGHRALPAVKAFAERAAQERAGQVPLVSKAVAREAAPQGILGFFDLLAAYRNAVIGHGTQWPQAFYAEWGPPLFEAVSEVLRQRCLFGGLTLAPGRVTADAATPAGSIEWLGLRGLEPLRLPSKESGVGENVPLAAAGKLYFVRPGVYVGLHPLAIYREDEWERRQVGFLNRTVLRRRLAAEGTEGVEEVRECQYLDYVLGAMPGVEARAELTRFLARLRGQTVSGSEVDRIIEEQPAEPEEGQSAGAGTRPGLTVGTDFELEGELGRGGMGVVYLAWQRSLKRQVALKVLPPELAADPVALARFEREIAALARCDHPNLVKVLTSGTEGELHFYAMEFVEGTWFRSLTARRKSGLSTKSYTNRLGMRESLRGRYRPISRPS